MKKQIARRFEYEDLGFPISLINVPVREIRGIVVPDIDYNVLQRRVLEALCHKPLPLTGNEVRFIRQYFQMTLIKFASHFGITHPTVINWEKHGNSFARISPATELCIRLYILNSLKTNDKIFREYFRKFNYTKFSAQNISRRKRPLKPITIDSSSL